jgi:hypothetical protein
MHSAIAWGKPKCLHFFTPFSGAEVFKEKERGNVAAVIR